MPHDNLDLECDRISKAVDGVQSERLRWARTEAPMLAKLVELAQSSIADRSDFEFFEEGGSNQIKRFVLKVHGNRIIAIAIWLDKGDAVLNAEVIARSKYSLSASDPISAEFSLVDEQWMAAALQTMFSRISL